MGSTGIIAILFSIFFGFLLLGIAITVDESYELDKNAKIYLVENGNVGIVFSGNQKRVIDEYYDVVRLKQDSKVYIKKEKNSYGGTVESYIVIKDENGDTYF